MTPAPFHFADRLWQAVRDRQTPLVVGIDPRLEQLPDGLHPGNEKLTFQEQADRFEQFSCEVIDVIAPLVPAIKPQAAFFEQLGPVGMVALGRVVDRARSAGLMVIMDAKRGDIGSTAQAYAAAYLGRPPATAWGCDALTVNPYLGHDSLTPFVDAAHQEGAGIFVLAKTSNPGSETLQEKKVDGRPVYAIVADQIQALAGQHPGELGYGAVGAVVGATYPEQLAELRRQMPNVPLLIPGFGAQGGTAKDVAGGFDENGLGAIVNSSRAIIFAYRRPEYEGVGDWQVAVERATRDAIGQLADSTHAGRLVAGA